MIEPLDKKTTDRIERLSPQQIVELDPKYIKTLTCDFDERCSRLILSKVTNISNQKKLLDAIKQGFDYCYMDFNGYYERDIEIPSYFEEWDDALAFGETITAEEKKGLPSQVPVQQAVSIPQLLDEEGMLKHWMSMCMNQLSAAVNDATSRAQDITKEIKSMRDGSITRLMKRVEELEAEKNASDARCKELVEKVNRLQSWYDDWQHLCNKIAAEYDSADILEAGGIDDPSIMADAIETYMDSWQLQRENEELRAKQEAWRESDEYKAERSNWEKANKQRIDVKDLKERLLKHAKTFTSNNSNLLHSIVLNLNEILRATAWEQVAPGIVEEVMAVVSAKEKPVIRPEKMEVNTLNAETVNDINHNDNVYIGKDGSKG
jgi:hypothetical protein